MHVPPGIRVPHQLEFVLLLHCLTVEEPGQVVEGILEPLAAHAFVTTTSKVATRDVFTLQGEGK